MLLACGGAFHERFLMPMQAQVNAFFDARNCNVSD
jgi:hypothetical protein